MFSKIRRIALLIIVIWCFTASAASAAKWTIMIYMAGDNNLSDSVVNDVLEMMKVGSSDQVNVVVQAELSPVFSSIKHNGHTYRFKVLKNRLDWYDLGKNLDMASPYTLADFITWASQNYPAERYAIFLWDHGLGWMGGNGDSVRSGLRGLLEDRTSGTFMSIDELEQALSQAGIRFDLIEFDACLMGMLEVAAPIYEYTRYITFSEAPEPGDGDPYDKILDALVRQPAMDARKLAHVVVDEYVGHYRKAKNGLVSVTKSAVLSTAVPALVSAVDALAQAFDRALDEPDAVEKFQRIQDEVQTFYGLTGSTDLYDLCSKAETIGLEVKEKARSVEAWFNDDYIFEAHYTPPGAQGGIVSAGSVSNAHGIAIFFPGYQDVTHNVMLEYQQACLSAGLVDWADFVEKLHEKIKEDRRVTAPGNFIIAAYWTTPEGLKSDADLDLYIVEPDAAYAPWMGQTTPNGFFSADSLDSGDNFEVYTARERVEKGLYLPVINLYDIDPWESVLAYCFYVPDSNLDNIITWGPHTMDFLFPAPDPEEWDDVVIYLLSMNFYSDWWIPGEVERLFSRAPLEATVSFWHQVRDQYFKKHRGGR